MEVKEFQDARNSELDAFKKQYASLKSKYSSALSSAIKEQDASEQARLIQEVQKINAELGQELHKILGYLNKDTQGFDKKDLNELTNDLIQYEKDYREIEKSKDKVTTLRIIKNTNRESLHKATVMYYIYMAILLLLSFYVGYLVFSTTFAQTFKQIIIDSSVPI
jgi:DNA repair exonuclease SbcCD ATPase subunit